MGAERPEILVFQKDTGSIQILLMEELDIFALKCVFLAVSITEFSKSNLYLSAVDGDPSKV